MKIISLFSGAGGLDFGLIQSGHEVIWASDNEPDAVATYHLNIGNHIELADIVNIDSGTIPDAEVVIGGFPCQGFSLANLKRHGQDERNELYLQFLRILRTKTPDYFLAENVRGILSLEGGTAIRKIVSDFETTGYRVQVKLFCTADYGVPQTRWRVIIVGTRKDIPESRDFVYPLPTHCKKQTTSLLKQTKLWISIREALKDIPEPIGDESDLPNHIYSKYKVTNRNFTGHRTTDPDKPSPTILARGNGKGGVCNSASKKSSEDVCPGKCLYTDVSA